VNFYPKLDSTQKKPDSKSKNRPNQKNPTPHVKQEDTGQPDSTLDTGQVQTVINDPRSYPTLSRPDPMFEHVYPQHTSTFRPST
jgi:hypothetical protein